MINVGILIAIYFLFSILALLLASTEKKWVAWLVNLVGFGAFSAHGYWIAVRTIEAKRYPFANTYETLILLSFLIMLIYLVTWTRHRMIALGGFAGIINTILLALTSLLSPDIEPLLPALKSNWLLFHVSACFIGYAAFGFAAAVAGVYLFGKGWRGIRSGDASEEEMNPSERLDYLDWLMYRSIVFGYPFLTLGIATGAIWANESWGRYWNWDPKETWAFISWIIYTICIHMRLEQRCHGARIAWMTLVGFLTIMFTYFGVNFWLSSLHAYA